MNILRLIFQFETEYKGYPLYISGNAFRHALGIQLNTSIGVFTNKKRFYNPKNYEDFFQPRMDKGLLTPFRHIFFSKYENKRKVVFFYRPSAVTFDIFDFDESLVDIIKEKELIRFGGGRNKGYGVVTLINHLIIDLDDLKLPNNGTHITLISPMLHIPKFVYSYNCRRDFEYIWNNGKKNKTKIIPHGQFFRLKEGKNVEKIALKGIIRKNLFGKFGYGEFIVNNWPKGVNQ